MNGIAVLQMLTFMKYENLERKWGNLGFKITENVLRLYLSLLWCSFSFLLIYEVIFCSFMESKSWHFFIHFFLTESRVLVALHCKVVLGSDRTNDIFSQLFALLIGWLCIS